MKTWPIKELILLWTIFWFSPFVSPAWSQTPATFFGMHAHSGVLGSQPWPPIPMGSIRLWDTYTKWNDLEPSKGVYTWSNLDGYLALAQAHNVDVLYTFGGTAAWAASGSSTKCAYSPGSCFPPSNIQDWDEFVTAVVAHAAGKIKYWELWNEPNLIEFWAGDVPTLVTMSQHAYKIIKAAEPSAIILSPAVTDVAGGSYLNSYLSAGGLGYLDVIAFHGYPSYTSYADPEGVVTILNAVKTAMASNQISGTPIWDTEGAWGLDTNLSNNANAQGAGYLAREYIIQWSNGVSRFYWYAWNNTHTGTLWTSSGGIQPAGVAYGQLYNWIVGATTSSPCTMASDSTWSCSLTRPGGYQGLAIWNSATTTSYTPASQYKQYLDLAGHTNPVNGSVTIGYNPILLQSSVSPPPPTNLKATSQ
jgi:polysaccharide biosynthesis protein PslG